MQSVCFSDPRILLRETVQHDVAAGADAEFLGGCNILRTWVRDVEGFVKVAVGVSRIECVSPLGSPVVAMPRLRPYGLASKSNLVRAYFPTGVAVPSIRICRDGETESTPSVAVRNRQEGGSAFFRAVIAGVLRFARDVCFDERKA